MGSVNIDEWNGKFVKKYFDTVDTTVNTIKWCIDTPDLPNNIWPIIFYG